MTTTDLSVLDDDAHGIPAAEYEEVLCDRLPDRRVRLAATPNERRRILREPPAIAGKHLSIEDVEAA